VKEGWQAAGGAFATPLADQPSQPRTVEQERSPPKVGAFVFDAFGEPAGRVKAVREADFLLDRPLARDLYVPFSAIRTSSSSAIRIGITNGRIGEISLQPAKLLGIFGGRAPARTQSGLRSTM